MSAVGEARRMAGAMWRRAFPTPVEAARRRIERLAGVTPRRTGGRVQLLEFDLAFADAGSLAAQWQDIFVRQSLRFTPAGAAPRILDCGANVGLASLYFKHQWPAARITAFEPDPAIASLLRGNLQRNGAADIEVVQAAAWRAHERLTFMSEGTDSGTLAPTHSDALASDVEPAAIQVEAVRLRDWLASAPVDLLKLDIEGAELDVLSDIESVLPGVAALHVEVHDFNPARRLLPQCLSILDRAGFVTAIGSVMPVTWRSWPQAHSPFPGAVPGWISVVRAWREPVG
jgi:FkbM family methyltransferase